MSTKAKAQTAKMPNFDMPGLDQANAAGQEAMNQFIELTAEVMKSGYENAESLAQTQMEQLKEAQARSTEVAAEQLKAVEEASESVVANTEAYWNSVAEFARTSTEQNLATARRMADAKSPAEWPEIQMDAFAKAANRFAGQALGLTQLASEASTAFFGPAKRMAEQNMEQVKRAAKAQ